MLNDLGAGSDSRESQVWPSASQYVLLGNHAQWVPSKVAAPVVKMARLFRMIVYLASAAG